MTILDSNNTPLSEIQIADWIDTHIIQEEPNTQEKLSELLTGFYPGVKFKITEDRYFGALQGVKVHLNINGKRYVRPKRKFTYGVFSAV